MATALFKLNTMASAELAGVETATTGDGDAGAGVDEGGGVKDGVKVGGGSGGGGEGATAVTATITGVDGAPTLLTVGAPAAASAVLRVLAKEDKAEAFEAMLVMLVDTDCWAETDVVVMVKLTAMPVASARRRAVEMSVTFVTTTALDCTLSVDATEEVNAFRAAELKVVDVRPASVRLLDTVYSVAAGVTVCTDGAGAESEALRPTPRPMPSAAPTHSAARNSPFRKSPLRRPCASSCGLPFPGEISPGCTYTGRSGWAAPTTSTTGCGMALD